MTQFLSSIKSLSRILKECTKESQEKIIKHLTTLKDNDLLHDNDLDFFLKYCPTFIYGEDATKQLLDIYNKQFQHQIKQPYKYTPTLRIISLERSYDIKMILDEENNLYDFIQDTKH